MRDEVCVLGLAPQRLFKWENAQLKFEPCARSSTLYASDYLTNMFPFLKSKLSYSTVEDGDYEEELKLGGVSQSKPRPCSLLLITIAFLLSVIPTLILVFD